jgi:hypothetical protein
MVRKRWWAGALAVSLALLSGVPAQAGVGVSVGIGFGGPCYRPYYYRPYYYGYPYYYPRVVVAPSVVVDPVVAAPVYPAPKTVVVPATPAPAAAPVQQQQQAHSYTPPAPTPVPPAPPPPGLTSSPTPVATSGGGPVRANWSPEAEAVMRHIGQGDERLRTDAIMQYGRARDTRALEPLTYTLASDQNPAVRDAAARALGLIGAPSSLESLQKAAMADDDRDVRRSAGYAADVIRSNLRR